jgi:hypothetical protein
MSTIKFVCDEDTQRALVACLVGMEPSQEVIAIGQGNAPDKGTQDHDLLLWAEQQGYSLLTRDRSTMPTHIANHLAGGHHTWGVFLLRENQNWQKIAESLILVWAASQAEEWRDRIQWIPQ